MSIREYPGDYSAFIDIRDRERAEAVTVAESIKAAAQPRKEKSAPDDAKRKLTFKEKRELEDLEARIAASESRKAEIERELETNASDHVLVQALYQEQQSLAEALDRDLNRWAELAELA